MTKAQLAAKYSISPSTLRKLMNVTFFDELKEVGYNTRQIILSPNVIRKWEEIYGEPINEQSNFKS